MHVESSGEQRRSPAARREGMKDTAAFPLPPQIQDITCTALGHPPVRRCRRRRVAESRPPLVWSHRRARRTLLTVRSRFAASSCSSPRVGSSAGVSRLGGFLAPFGVLSTLALAAPSPASEAPPPGVVDLHVDLSYQVNFKGRDAGRGSGQYDVAWLRRAGVRGVVLPLYVPRDVSPSGPAMKHLEGSYAKMRELLPALPGYELGLCGPSARDAGVQFAFEGAEPLGWELDSVERWIQRGVRSFGLVHSYHNALASSSGEGSVDPGYGLSRRGAELVRRIHARGGMVDVSHASDRAFSDVVRQALAAGRPVIATHSNARALANHPRNLTDQQLRSIARTGGVIGINFHSRFLLGGPGVASIDDVVRHVLHVMRVAGVAHVAIGSDFEGGILPAAGLEDIRGFPRLARALREAGVSAEHLGAIFGNNARRVLCAPAGSLSEPAPSSR